MIETKEISARAGALVARMPQGFQAALIGTEVNRFYLLDFDAGDAGALLLLPQRMVYIIDSRYIEIARREVQNAEVILEDRALEQLAALLKKEGVTKLCLETGISLAALANIQKNIPSVDLDTSDTLSKNLSALRQIKGEEEIRRMRAAQKVTDACFTHILPFIREGVREVDLMLEMEHFMRAHGAEKVAFDTICVAGSNTSLPHGVPGEYRLKSGDFVTMDFGARVRGYCTDMTRTVVLGQPGEEQRKVYDTVLRAHLAGIAAVRGGASCVGVDTAARDVIDSAGYKGYFGHGLGHGVGIQVHEEPRFSQRAGESTAQPGMMMTVEPGVYLPGRFGCRIEDTVLVTETGCQPLPSSEKELIVL